MSTAMLGPRRSKAYDSRFAVMDRVAPGMVCGLVWSCIMDRFTPYPGSETPTYTQVSDPASDSAGMAASSSASAAISSSSRCCGSVCRASAGDMPK